MSFLNELSNAIFDENSFYNVGNLSLAHHSFYHYFTSCFETGLLPVNWAHY